MTNFNHSADEDPNDPTPPYSFETITTSKVYKTKGIAMKSLNAAWNDIKLKSEQYSNDIFKSLENKTKNMKVETIGNDW